MCGGEKGEVEKWNRACAVEKGKTEYVMVRTRLIQVVYAAIRAHGDTQICAAAGVGEGDVWGRGPSAGGICVDVNEPCDY